MCECEICKSKVVVTAQANEEISYKGATLSVPTNNRNNRGRTTFLNNRGRTTFLNNRGRTTFLITKGGTTMPCRARILLQIRQATSSNAEVTAVPV